MKLTIVHFIHFNFINKMHSSYYNNCNDRGWDFIAFTYFL